MAGICDIFWLVRLAFIPLFKPTSLYKPIKLQMPLVGDEESSFG